MSRAPLSPLTEVERNYLNLLIAEKKAVRFSREQY